MRLTGAIASRVLVVNVTLPATVQQERELVPTLVDERTRLPPRLALRWVMRSRRNAVSEKTLADGLRAAAFEERVDAATLEVDKLEKQVHSLLARLALIEANAKRIGIDPEELYRPVGPPDRRVANIFGSRKKNSSSHR